jgi:hypothetical protein
MILDGGAGFRAHVEPMQSGASAAGPVTYRMEYDEVSAHRVTLLVMKAKDALDWYLIDANGRPQPGPSEPQWVKDLPKTIQSALRKIMIDDHLYLNVFDTPNQNFEPQLDTIEFLNAEFGVRVEAFGMCKEWALAYAVEMMCTVKSIGPDADRLTRFVNRDVLRRKKIFTSVPKTPREEAELILYSRALAFGLYRHIMTPSPIELSAWRTVVVRRFAIEGVPCLERMDTPDLGL